MPPLPQPHATNRATYPRFELPRRQGTAHGARAQEQLRRSTRRLAVTAKTKLLEVSLVKAAEFNQPALALALALALLRSGHTGLKIVSTCSCFQCLC